jgi:uncharacterized protein YjlB
MDRSIKIAPLNIDAEPSHNALPATEMRVEPIVFKASDWVPNHPYLPVLIYRSAIPPEGEMAPKFEEQFGRNGWQGIWRNGVFDYQHYHTGAHEVLGIAGGRARLLIGGPGGEELSVNAGDCLVLPAGTGHMRIDASRDFLVVGAYPPGQEADIQTGPPSPNQLRKIRSVPLPNSDPLKGLSGPLLRFWSRQ